MQVPWEASSCLSSCCSAKQCTPNFLGFSFSPCADFRDAYSRPQAIPFAAKFWRWEILRRSISTLAAIKSSRRSTFTRDMDSSGASTTPIREMVDWDFWVFSGLASVNGTPIPDNIDPEGLYAVRTDFGFGRAQSPPIPTPGTTPVDDREPVSQIILQGDMKIYHERCPEDPPVAFEEGEDVDKMEKEKNETPEDETRGSILPEPPKKRARTVDAGNVATLDVAEEGLTFASVLKPYVRARPAKNE